MGVIAVRPERRWAYRGLPAPVGAGWSATCSTGGERGGAGAAEADGRGPCVGARTRGKSDPIDALAVARAALREPDLPVASTTASRELKLLVDRREDLVGERTRRSTGCGGTCTSSTPSRAPPGSLRPGQDPRRARRRWLATAGIVAEMAATSSPTSRGSPGAINALERRIAALVEPSRPPCSRCPVAGR